MRSFLVLCVVFTTSSCHLHFKNILNYGSLRNDSFYQELEFEEQMGLPIIRVVIKGKTYRFLFDTGAPNAISTRLQSELQFRKIGSRTIRDSQGTLSNADYVRVESLYLGTVEFRGVSSFVADLDQNPALRCLKLDGILGSPSMRHCIWQIDFADHRIRFTDEIWKLSYYNPHQAISYQTDDQYSIKLDYEMEKADIRNIKVDYGSMNAITLPRDGMERLASGDALDAEILKFAGFAQIGLFGDLVESTRYYSRTSGRLGDMVLHSAQTKSGGKNGGLVGTEVLRDYVVTINFPAQKIHFFPVDDSHSDARSFGLVLGWRDGYTYVQSVMEKSPAVNAGLMPGDTIVQLNKYNLTTPEGFCNCILNKLDSEKELELSKVSKQQIQKVVLKD